MLCKRMALALLLPLSLVALVGVGCGGNNDNVVQPPTPRPSSDAGITGFSISVGELSPAFGPTINRYSTTVGILGEDSIGVTVTLKDPKARLRVNGLDVASGARTNIGLPKAVNTINAVVTAEDGVASNTVTLTVNKLPLNTRVWVLNGMGGVAVENTLLKLTDAKGNVLADNVPLPKEKNGQLFFGLDPAQKYNIYAKGTASAVGCYANFDPAKEDTAAIYCSNTSTTYYALEAPVIEEIAFGTANLDTGGDGGWKVMPNSAYYVGTLANVAAVRVTAFTSNLNAGSTTPSSYDEWVETTTKIAAPVRISIDNVASANAGGVAGATGALIGARNTPVTSDGKVIGYRSVYRFTTPVLQANLFNKEHFLSVMAADCIGNRTEQRVYLTITDSSNAVESDPDLTGIVLRPDLAQAQTFVGDGNYQGKPGAEVNAIDQPENYNGYAVVFTRFYALTASNAALAIRGYEVWRSIGNEDNFVKIGTVNYATLNSQTGYYEFLDRTPGITVGDMYYKFRVFNGNPTNNGYSRFSVGIKAVVLPPFYVRLAQTHQLVSPTVWPTFKIAVSDPDLLKNASFGQMKLCLTVKYADNPYLFMLVPMLLSSEKRTSTDPYDWAGTVPAYVLRGFTYNISTSAISGGSWAEAYDYEDVPDGTDDQGNPKTKRVFTPFVKVGADGTIAIDTGSPNFQKYVENAVRVEHGSTGATFLPGATYHWNIMGDTAGVNWNSSGYPGYWSVSSASQAAWVGSKEANSGGTFRGVTYGSAPIYGFGSPEGWFPLIIAADAE